MSISLGKILIVDDNEDILLAGRLLLREFASLVHTEKDPEMIPNLLKNENYDIILLDMNFTRDVTSGSEGFYWLKKILEIDASAIVILITAYGDVEMAVRAIKEGATDFVLKPWQNEKILATLSSAMSLRRSMNEVSRLRSREKQLYADMDQRYHDMIGVCPAMQRVFTTIEKVAETDANVLILGENGTGKELVARALHRQSRRANEGIISVDMGAITDTLFESELFGHVRGAFTDAKQDRIGRFELASGGSLFLDEIGNLTLAQQSKLLRALEERSVIRIGSNKSLDIDIRLICATNMPIYEMVSEKKFRQDLLYRINTVEIQLPPLRERIEDIPLLVDFFLNVNLKKYKKDVRKLSPATLKKLQSYNWPGNIRELRHAIERAVILSDSTVLQPSDFHLADSGNEPELVFDSFNLERMEKTIIHKVLSLQSENISQAAKELGITRTALYRRMKKYGF